MKLENLIQSIEIDDQKNPQDIQINGVAYHSQKVLPGDLFVCVKGFKTDGHKYLKDAIKNGAKAAIVEAFQPVEIPQYKVNNSRKALAEVSASFYQHPSKQMHMVGVTATNGKTTTTYMLNSILESSGKKTGLIGTVVIKNDQEIKKATLTTPESLDLQKYLHEMAKNNVSHVTMEASSAAIKLMRNHGVDYDVVALNNLSKEHMGFHKSLEDYRNTKKGFITSVKKSGWAVLNLDDEQSSSLVDQVDANVITYGINDQSGHITIENLDLSTGVATFDVVILKPFKNINPQRFEVKLSVAGYHSVYNAIAALSMALASDISIEDIQKGLSAFKGVERRFEMIYDREFKVFDDHFANVGNINVTFKTMEFMTYDSLVLIYAIRGSRGVITNRENAEAIVEWSKKLGFNKVIATMSRRTTGEKDNVTEEELNVFKEVVQATDLEVEYYDRLEDAIEEGLARVNPSDVILLAGCQGMDHGGRILLEKISKGLPKDEKEEIMKPLRSRVAGMARDLDE